MPELGVPHARRVEHHEHRPIGEMFRAIDQPRHFLRRENCWEPAWDLRKRNVFQQVRALQRLHEEEPERGDVELYRARPELPLAEEIRLILTKVRVIESIRGRVEEPGESLDSLEVVVNGGLGVVAPLKFLEHRASEMGHKTPPVTRTLRAGSSVPHA